MLEWREGGPRERMLGSSGAQQAEKAMSGMREWRSHRANLAGGEI